jgi:magnesium chelatase subunit I
VQLPEAVAENGIRLIQKLGIDSLRAEITLFETARAHAAADGRSSVRLDDLRIAAPMALRLRQSAFMSQYFKDRQQEDEGLLSALDNVIPDQDIQGK